VRDTHACGRARPAQPGRPPLGAPPWRCRPRPALPLRRCRRIGRDGLLAPGAFLPDCGAGLFVSVGYEPRSTPRPRSAFCRIASRKRPLRARMTNPILYIRYVVNKYLHIVVDRLRPAMWADARTRTDSFRIGRRVYNDGTRGRSVSRGPIRPAFAALQSASAPASSHVSLPAMIWSCRAARQHRRSPASSERPHRGDGSRSGDWRRRANI
jgi:hypothetical protein